MNKIFTTSIIISIILLIIYFTSGFLKKILSPAPTINQSTSIYKSEDINKDKKVDTTDEDIISKQLNCKKTESCWNKVIGKTLNGDNPIYTFDLDMNGDEKIDQLDVNQILNAK